MRGFAKFLHLNILLGFCENKMYLVLFSNTIMKIKLWNTFEVKFENLIVIKDLKI